MTRTDQTVELTLLGTGTPSPSLKRASSSYVIRIGDDVLAFEHGPGAGRRLLQAGYEPTDITHLFFSHLHYDHFVEYPVLLLQHWDIGAGRIPPLKVFGPPPIAVSTELLIGENGAFAPDIRARVEHQGSIDIYAARGGETPRERPRPEVREVAPGDVIGGDGWQVTVGEAQHVQPYLECYAYRIDTDQGSLCYSGDSGGVAESVIELARGCDVLLHMNHFWPDTAPTEEYRRVCGNHIDNAIIASRAGVDTLVLTHILEQIDQPGIRERIIHEIRTVFDGDVIWGEDLMRLGLGSPSLERMD